MSQIFNTPHLNGMNHIIWADIYMLYFNLSPNSQLRPSIAINDTIKERHPELFQALQDKWQNALETKR